MNIPELIYTSFQREEKERIPQDNVTFAPSYLSKCGRAIYYQKKGEKATNPPDLAGLLKMYWGDLLHDDIQKRLNGLLESFEEPRMIDYEGLRFYYFYDGILNDNGNRAILEIKTVYASGYKSIEERPKDEHVLQSLSYMIFEGIDKGIILYAGRDNGYLKQFKLEYQDDLNGNKRLLVDGKDYLHYQVWKDKIDKCKRLKVQIESGTPPERDYQIVMKNTKGEISFSFDKDKTKYKSDWQCSYCSYRNTCWKPELEEMKNHKFYINQTFS